MKVRGGAPPGIVVAWWGDGIVHYTASFDGGCSFCPPISLSAQGYYLSIQALETPAGEPLILIGNYSLPSLAILRGIGTSWTCAGLPGPSDFTAIPVPIRPDAFSPHKITAAYPQDPGSPPHVYLSYISAAGGRLDCHVSVDLDDDSIFGEPGEPHDIPLGWDPTSLSGSVQMEADGLGASPQDTGAVVFLGVQQPRDGVALLRTSDSGRNWSADGTPPPIPPAGPPLMAVERSSCDWSCGAAWAAPGEGRWQGAICSDVSGDIAFQSGPTSWAPDWSDPDIEFVDWSTEPVVTGLLAGIGFTRGPSPSTGGLYLFWQAPAPHGTDEIWYQYRPLAPPSKPSGFLPGVVLSGMNPPRTTLYVPGSSPVVAGPLIISDLDRVWVFWAERDRGIFYSRSDAEPAALSGITAVADPGCPPRIHLAWDPPAECDLQTIRLSWGLQAGGPYDFSLDLPPAPGHILDGLLGGTDYHILVQTLDEAGNLWPPGTDPTVSSPENLAAELPATTPACPCAAGAWIAGPPPAETCAGDPVSLDSAGSFVQGCAGPLGIEWSEGGNPPFSTAPSVQVVPIADTSYGLRVTCPSQPGCEASASHDVQFHPLPVADPGGPYATCDRGSGSTDLTFDGSASTASPPTAIGKYGYEWTASEGTFTGYEKTAYPRFRILLTGIPRVVAVNLRVTDLLGCQSLGSTTLTLVTPAEPPPIPGPLLVSRDPALPAVLRFRWTDAPFDPRVASYQILRLTGSVPSPTPSRFAAEGVLVGSAPSGVAGVDSPEIGAPSPGATFYAVRAVSPCADLGSTCDPSVPPCP